MIGISSNKIEKRKFKYYPRYHKDDAQAKLNNFVGGYQQKKLDSERHLNQTIKDGFEFKRSVKHQKQKQLTRRMRVNFFLLLILIAIVYGIVWVVKNKELFISVSHQWTT